jgi:hypothetical protein
MQFPRRATPVTPFDLLRLMETIDSSPKSRHGIDAAACQ